MDNETFAFRPKARILKTLGEELISSETVALIELVKNSYDADARKVLIRFSGTFEKGKGSIEVIDDGHGMSLTKVQTAWMEPATNVKRKRKVSEKLLRRMLGEKGIGRFASSRLAHELELITKRKSAKQEVYSYFDWTQFDDENKYLDEIEVLCEERKPQDICSSGAVKCLYDKDDSICSNELNHGTILKMSGLKHQWDEKLFEELQRGLSRLIPPYKKQTDFTIRLELPEKFSQFSSEISTSQIVKYPHYGIKGSVDEDGTFSFSIRIHETGEKKGIKGCFQKKTYNSQILLVPGPNNNRIGLTPNCGPLEIELKVWNRDELGNVEQMVKSSIRDIRRDLDSIAGINIYRDDFRVLPYGEPHNDWLRLDIRRVQKPTYRLSNNQVVGYIKIRADDNPKLKDQSNREGLDDNQAFHDLRGIMLCLLTELEAVRYKQRPRKNKKKESFYSALFGPLPLDKLQKHLSDKHPEDDEAKKLFDEAEEKLLAQIENVQTVIGRYQRLATLGQLIDVVLHDGRQPIATILNEALLGREEIEDNGNENIAILTPIAKKFMKIEGQGSLLKTTFNRLEPFGGRRRGRPKQLYIEKIIHDAFDVMSTAIKKLNVKTVLPKTETLVKVDESEFQEVIINLLQNSLYWIQQVDKNKRSIIVSVKRVTSNNLQVIFADTGPGIPKDFREEIFEPYFSKKPEGIGLGLSIAGEIVSDFYGGKLELLENQATDGAVFRITLKKRV